MISETSLRRLRVWLSCFGLVAGGLHSAAAGDWPAYRGPSGNGVCAERINTEWPSSGPDELWRQPLEDGFSSVTVAEGRVFTLVLDRRGQTREACVAFDATDGTRIWSTDVGRGGFYQGGPAPHSRDSDGPRSTPVWHEGRVFALATYLQLSCLDAETGSILWQKHLEDDFDARTIPWHSAASPLIHDGVLVLNTGRSGRAVIGLNPSDGSLIWRQGSGNSTHATPIPSQLGGVSQVIFATKDGLLSLDPSTGEERWQYPLGYNGTSVGASPVVVGDIVYGSAAYGTGAGAVRVTSEGGRMEASEVWRKVSAQLMNHWMTPVAYQGHVYGYYGQHKYNTAPLSCVDVATGTVLWSRDGFGNGGLLRVGELLLAATDRGEIVLAEATPAGYRERRRFGAIQNGVVWNSPAISDGRLFVRSTKEIAAFDVSLPPPPPLELGAGWIDALTIRITARNHDRTPIEPGREEGMRVLWATDLARPAEEWDLVDASWTRSEGALFLEQSIDRREEARYYRVSER